MGSSTARTKARRTSRPSAPPKGPGLTTLSPDGLYRRAQFIPSIFGFGKTHWHDGVKSGEYPAPVVQKKRLTLWAGRDLLALSRRLTGSSA